MAAPSILMQTEFLVSVIPGLDPGIAPAVGVRGDPRIKSGDDDEKVNPNTYGVEHGMTHVGLTSAQVSRGRWYYTVWPPSM
jgi:hypothetical protein